MSDEVSRLQWYKYLLGDLPVVSYCTLKRIITHLARLVGSLVHLFVTKRAFFVFFMSRDVSCFVVLLATIRVPLLTLSSVCGCFFNFHNGMYLFSNKLHTYFFLLIYLLTYDFCFSALSVWIGHLSCKDSTGVTNGSRLKRLAFPSMFPKLIAVQCFSAVLLVRLDRSRTLVQ